MMFNYKSTNLSSTTSLPSLLSSSIGGSSHHLHNPLSVLTTSGDQGSLTNSIHNNNNVGNFPIFGQSQQQICLECALAFLFDKSQLSLRKIKLLDVLKQLVSPSSMSCGNANSVVNLDHVCGLLLSTCLKVILPSSSTASSSMIVLESSQALKMKPNNQTSCLPSCAENNIIEEVIRMWLEIVPTDKLLSRDFALIVRMMSGISQEQQQLGDVCTNFLCLLLDKICSSLQSEDCWNIVSIPVEAFSSLLTILINNFISTQTFSKVENEQKSDVLFIILKLCQIVQLHSDSSRIGHNLWSNAKSLESFLDTILACLLKADDEDLHINAMAVLHCLVRFDKEALDVLSIIDYRRLIDALISVILSPNISIQIICNQLILECSTKSPDATLQFVNSDISDFLFEALSKDTSGEVSPSILAIFHSLLLCGNSLSGSNFLNNFQELGITALLKIFPSKVETIDHLNLSNNILSIFYMYYLNSVQFGHTSQKDFQNNFNTLCEQISITMINFNNDVVKEMLTAIGLNFKTLCEICYLFLQQSTLYTSKLMQHLTVLFSTILKNGVLDEVEEGLATFVICAIGLARLSDFQQVDLLTRIDELILEHVNLSDSLHERFLRICHDYIYQRLVQQKWSHILACLLQKKFVSLSINSSGGMTITHKQLLVQLLVSLDLLDKPVKCLDRVDFSPNCIMGMLRSDLLELGIALLHCTLFNNETIIPLNTLLSTISTIILDTSLNNLSTLARLRLSELFVGLSLHYSFSTIPSTISNLVLGWYLECMKLTNFNFKERTSLFVKWASQQESTTSGITRTLLSGLISMQSQSQDSYLLGILKDARVELVPTLVSLFIENSTSKNSTTQFLRILSEYFTTEALVHEKDSTLVIQKIIEPTLSNIYISLKKGCNTNLTSTLDEITRCTSIILDYSRNVVYLSTIFNHYSKIFHSIADLKLDLKTIGITMNILTKIIYLIRSADDNGTSFQRLSSFQVKSNLTRSLQSIEKLLNLVDSDSISNGFIISIFQLVTALLRSMGSSEDYSQIFEVLLKFTILYLNNDSPLLRILSTCTFHTILSTSKIDNSKFWSFNLVYALLNNILSRDEDLLAIYSIKSLYLLEIGRKMSEAILAQSMWNEFIVSSIINDSRNEEIFRPSCIIYMCSIMWTCPPLFNQLFGPYLGKRDFFRKLIDSANTSCVNEWKALIETLLTHTNISAEDKVFIAERSFESCTKLEDSIQMFESHIPHHGESRIASDIFLHPQLLEIGRNKEFTNVLQNLRHSLSKQFNINH